MLSLEINLLLLGMVSTNFPTCLQKNLGVSDINIVCNKVEEIVVCIYAVVLMLGNINGIQSVKVMLQQICKKFTFGGLGLTWTRWLFKYKSE